MSVVKFVDNTKIRNHHLLFSTSPPTQPARKPRSFVNLDHRHRHLYGRTRRNNTGKELDSETGLYYYGARYMDPKISRWLSGDPAMGEYVPSAPVNDEARKRNGSLPGMGGVFNCVNLHAYHYAGNNPVKYVDPDGRSDIDFVFISRLEDGQHLSGYVPNRNGVAIQRSGVTIATGFDIGQHNSFDLNKIFGYGPENADLKALYTPYLELRRGEAIAFLEANPLTITQEQADRTDAAVMSQMVPRVARAFNDATKGNLYQLPAQAQTVIFSLGYQFGPDGIPKNVMTMINDGDYSGAATVIQNMGRNEHTYRRTQEANLLRQILNRTEN